MSTETIINRTPESDGMRRERLKLEAESQTETGASAAAATTQTILKAEPITETVREYKPIHEQNEGSRLTGIRSSQGVKGFIDGAKEDKLAQDDSADVLKRVLDDMMFQQRLDDKFKKQVISAFKHLGLDTSKFFD